MAVARGPETSCNVAEGMVFRAERLAAKPRTAEAQKSTHALQAFARLVNFTGTVDTRGEFGKCARDLLGSDAPESSLNRLIEFETKRHWMRALTD